MQFKIINPSEYPEWDRFVHTHENSSIYHTSNWNAVLRKTYGFSSSYFIWENSQKIKAGIATLGVGGRKTNKKLVGLPFTPYCNPLFDEEDNLNKLLDEILEYKNEIKTSSFEIRTKSNSETNFGAHLTGHNYFMTHILPLNSDLDKIKSQFHKSCILRPLKKLTKNPLVLHISKDSKDLKAFYKLQLQTRRKHGTIPQPYRYFANMWSELHNHGMMDLLLAYHNDQLIAGIIVLKYKDTVIYQSGASDNTSINLHPYHFLIWNAIKRAHAKNFQFFDFGRSSLDDVSLATFKERWGAKKQELNYYFHPKISGITSMKQTNWKYKTVSELVRHSPLPFLRAVGSLGYKFLG